MRSGLIGCLFRKSGLINSKSRCDGKSIQKIRNITVYSGRSIPELLYPKMIQKTLYNRVNTFLDMN